MPCCARPSTSLIVLLFSEVNSSSSLMRSRMGPTWRCTYFLLANGCVTRFTKLGSSPSQKSLGVEGGSGSLSLALALCEAEAVAAGCGVEFESVCCATRGSAIAMNRSMDRNVRFFIFDFLLPSGTLGAPLQPDGVFLTSRLCPQRAKRASESYRNHASASAAKPRAPQRFWPEYYKGLSSYSIIQPSRTQPREIPRMSARHAILCGKLKQLGFTQENQMRLYGEEFKLLRVGSCVSEP